MSDSQRSAVKYGFIVMDDERALFGTLSGMDKEILHEFSVVLPKKQVLGDKSALHMARFVFTNYVRKIADLATQYYINQETRQPNVSGLILAGFDYLMTPLTDMLDPTLRGKILYRAIVAYGGDHGFNQAINMCSEYLADVKFVQEKCLIWNFFDEALAGERGDPWNFVFGLEETLKALESGAVKTLMMCENTDISSYIAKNSVTGEISIQYSNEAEEEDQSGFCHLTTNEELKIKDNQLSLKCLAAKYNSAVEFVSNKTQESYQFCHSFKGIGGILRHQPGGEKGKGV